MYYNKTSELCPSGIRYLKGDNGGKKGKGLVKDHVWMAHRHGQQCGDGLWEQGWAGQRRAKVGGGGNRDNCNRITVKQN